MTEASLVPSSNPENISNEIKTNEMTSKHMKNRISPKNVKGGVRNRKANQSFQCDHCNKDFVNKGNLTNHINRKHLKTVNSICKVCNASFGSNNALKNHFNVKHDQNPTLYHCKFCDKVLKHPSMLYKHQNLYCHFNPTYKKFVKK